MDQVEALLFDVFGTVTDWRSSIERALREFAQRKGIAERVDWPAFADEWRQHYYAHTKGVAAGKGGTVNTDEVHRQYLDQMLQSEQWGHLASYFDEKEKGYLVHAWRTIQGWPDSSEGLYALEKQKLVGALSNGNIRLLVGMVHICIILSIAQAIYHSIHAGQGCRSPLGWDVVFSTELFSTFKPDPKVYLSAAKHLSLPPSKIAMVAAHIWDLRSAASVGMKTIYVPRAGEDPELETKGEVVKSKDQGGEVDVVAGSFVEIAQMLAAAKTSS
ncbi:hypothetical protein AX16_006655 [Volvariella volvacea WC 439]|nr:hypothetical protein AX16_006655 [Volvariella volvacea WC 439]